MGALRLAQKRVDIVDKYFEDLYDETGLEKYGDYIFAASVLFDTPFKSVLTLDQNRTLEAFTMREWLFKTEYEGPVNCLEILWHLALKLSDQCLCSEKYGDPRDGFWEIWRNLRLDIYDGLDFTMKSEIEYLLECWMERRYLRDGNGGCFPLFRPKKDQRKVELWYQMSEYLAENDVIEG